MTEIEIDDLMKAVRVMRDQANLAYQFGADSYSYSAMEAALRVEERLAALEPFMRQRATRIPVVYPPAAQRRRRKPEVQTPPWEDEEAA